MKKRYLLVLVLVGIFVFILHSLGSFTPISQEDLYPNEEKGFIYPRNTPTASSGVHYMIEVPVQWRGRYPRSSSFASAKNLNLP